MKVTNKNGVNLQIVVLHSPKATQNIYQTCFSDG